MKAFPPTLPVAQVRDRLRAIFPDGTPHRNYVTRRMAARTVFAMLYAGAIEGAERWLRPDQVTRLTDAQAAKGDAAERESWSSQSMRPATGDIPGRWYATNTREPIRDETLRSGLVRMGAVREREGLPTTSPRPRYALASGFARLFDPELEGEELASAIHAWRNLHLSSGALARVAIMRRGGTIQADRVLVTFPDGEARHMEPGPSSVISKAVIEEFAARYLEEPAVIWLSESRKRVVARDDALAREIGLRIEPDRNLPDLILVDLGPSEPLLVFVEVVATTGPINEARRTALAEVALEADFRREQLAFVTAYADRGDAAFKASVSELAWQTFVWFMSEPNHIVVMRRGDGDRRASLGELQGPEARGDAP